MSAPSITDRPQPMLSFWGGSSGPADSPLGRTVIQTIPRRIILAEDAAETTRKSPDLGGLERV